MFLRGYLTSLGVPLASQSTPMPLSRGVSNDGLTFIVGDGVQGALITVPEPHSVVGIALAGISLLLSGRHRRLRTSVATLFVANRKYRSQIPANRREVSTSAARTVIADGEVAFAVAGRAL